MKKKTVDHNTIYILLCLSIIAICIVFLVQLIVPESQKDKTYAYQMQQDTGYKVYLTPNEFFGQSYMEENQVYVSKLIQSLLFTMTYQANSSVAMNWKANYDIYATLSLDYTNTNQTLLKKDYDIVRGKPIEIAQTNKMNFTETVTLDYATYNNEVTKFKETFGIPIKAMLTIYFKVNAQVELDGQIQNKQSTEQLSMELNQPVFEIKKQQIGDTLIGTMQPESSTKIEMKYRISFWTFILCTAIASLVILVRRNKVARKSIFYIELHRLLKRYGDIIVELAEAPKLEDAVVVKVKGFDQLLDLEEEIREPILFYETEEAAVFQIVVQNLVYECKMMKNGEDIS